LATGSSDIPVGIVRSRSSSSSVSVVVVVFGIAQHFARARNYATKIMQGGGANNLNGGGGRRQALSSVDFYRRVPKDLTEVCIFDARLHLGK
jgi:hypothetical protein